MKILFIDQILVRINKRRGTLFLVLIIGLGLFLRIYGLDNPGLWYDELRTFDRVNGDMGHTFNTLKESYFPPLYYILMNIWCGFFGFSEFSLRFPSMLFSTFSIIAIYFLAKTMFSQREGLISALLLCVSSYAINYAQEAKPYSMFWFLGIISFLHFFRYVNEPHRKNLVLYGIFSSAMIYTFYLGLILLFVQNALFVIFYREKIKSWITTNLLIILSFAPWWYFAFYNLAKTSEIQWIKSTDYLVFFKGLFMWVSGIAIGNSVPGEVWFFTALLIFAFIFSIYTAITQRDRSRVKNYLVLFAWPIVYVLAFIFIDIFHTHSMVPRYLGVIHIPIIIIYSVGIVAFSYMRLGWMGNLATVLLFSSALYFHVFPYHRQEFKIDAKDHWREFMPHFCEVADTNSIVFTRTGYDALNYYGKCYKGQVVKTYLKEINAAYLQKNDLLKRSYNSIFLIYWVDRGEISNWVLKHKVYEKKIGTIGFIQIRLPLKGHTGETLPNRSS